jgi:hypothetical protein
MTKITKKQMFEIVKAGVETGEFAISTDLIVEFCEKEIAALETKAVKAKERAAAKKAEADVLIGQVEDVLTDEYQVIADIAEKVCAVNADATVSKVTNRLTKLVEAGVAEKTQVTIPATEGGKSRKLQAYRLASN